jgi:hypothetical protein
MGEREPAVKDPVTPEHKRFLLQQVQLRHWVMAAIALALVLALLVAD